MYGFGLILICKVISCTLLFETFFDVMRIFSSIQPKSECNLPFPYGIIFQTCQYFEPPCSTLGGDKHMRPRNLLWNSTPNNFYLKPFFLWCVFLAVLSPKLNVICHFSTILYFNHFNLSSPKLHSGERVGAVRHMPSRTFLYEIQFWITFIWRFFQCNVCF